MPTQPQTASSFLPCDLILSTLFRAYCQKCEISTHLAQESHKILTELALKATLSVDSPFRLSVEQQFIPLLTQQHPNKAHTRTLIAFFESLPDSQVEAIVSTYFLALKAQDCSESTIKNYRSDIKQFLTSQKSVSVREILSKPKRDQFTLHLAQTGQSRATIKRKLSSLSSFGHWLEQHGFVQSSSKQQASLENTFTQIDKENQKESNNIKLSTNPPQKSWWPSSFLSKLSTAFIAVLSLLGLSFFVYQQFILQAPINLAYPTALERPNRTLSFQGRLTDSAQNPITIATNLDFELHDHITDENVLWDSGTCSVTPDQDGIFSVELGGTGCGSEIAASVFSENADLWLEVQVGAETLSPRQKIKSVGYALNAETLQGFPPVEPADTNTKNNVLVMNNDGQVLLAVDSGDVELTSSDDFVITGTVLTLTTTSNGNLFLSPNGLGNVIATRYLEAPGATISSTYADGKALILKGGPSGTANIQEWQNSSGTVLSSVNESGNIAIGTTAEATERLDVNGNILVQGGGTIDARAAGTLSIGGTTQTGLTLGRAGANTTLTGNTTTLTGATAVKVSNLSTNGVVYTSGSDGTLNSEAQLAIARGGTNASSIGSAGSVAYSTGTAYSFSAVGSSGECLKSGGAGSPTWGACAAAASSVAWDDITAPDANLSLGMSTFTTAFNWATGTGSNNLFSLTSDNNANGTGSLANIQTGTTSTVSPLRVRAGTTEALFVDSAGNIGIGTTVPTTNSKLTVKATGSNTRAIDLIESGEESDSLVSIMQSSAGEGEIAVRNASGNTKIGLLSLTNYGLINLFDSTDALSIALNSNTNANSYFNTGGNLGIGTSSPAAKLEVAGAFGTSTTGMLLTNQTAASTSNISQMGFKLNRTTGGLTEVAQIQGLITDIGNTSYKGALAFLTSTNNAAPTEKMRLDANGNLGIGSTAPGATLDVTGTGRFSSTLTASNGLTLTTGALNLTGTSGALALSGLSASSISTGANNLTFTSGNFNTTATGINGTNIGATTPGTAAFTTLSATGAVTFSNANTSTSGALYSSSGTLFSEAQLDETRGGTGIGTYATGDILYASGVNTLAKLAAGTNTHVLTLAGGVPTWAAPGTASSVAWDDITAPAADLSLAMTQYSTTFNWGNSTGADDLFSMTTDANADGTGYLLNLQTGTGTTTVKPLRVRAGSVEALAVSTTGNVGIGTTSPSANLHVEGSELRIKNGTGVPYFVMAGRSSDGRAELAFRTNDASTDNARLVGLTGALAIDTNGSERIRIDSNGNVGIGDTTPDAALDVVGDVYISSGLSTFGTAVSDGTIEATQFCTGDGETNCVTDFDALSASAGIWTDAGSYIYTTNGEVLGNSTSGGANKVAGLYLSDSAPLFFGTDNDFRAYFNGTNFSLSDGTNNFLTLTDAGTAGTFAFNTDDLTVNSSGNIGVGTTAPLRLFDVAGSGRFSSPGSGVLTGSIDPTASTTVTGVGTAFLTELQVGDRITVSGETRTVVAIGGDLSLTVDSAFTDNANDTSPDRFSPGFIARNETAGAVAATFYSNQTDDILNAITNSAMVFRVMSTGEVRADKFADISSGGSAYYLDPAAAGTGLALAGNAGLGVTSPTHRLELATHTTAAGGIGFGTDVELYRSAADTLSLASGDSLNLVSGNVSIGGTNVITSDRLFYAADGDDVIPSYSFSNSTSTGLFLADSTDLSIAAGGGEVARFDDSGNVGIGTFSPLAKLDVAGGFGTSTTAQKLSNLSSASTSNISQLGFNLNRTTGGLTEVAQIRGLITDIGNTSYKGALAFLTSTNNAAPTEKMRIAADGNVGIGTTTALELLHVAGSMTINNAQSYKVRSIAGTPQTVLSMDGSNIIGVGDFTSSFQTRVGGTIVSFYTNGSERARFDATGNLGIGTVSPAQAIGINKSNNTVGVGIGQESSAIEIANPSSESVVSGYPRRSGLYFSNTYGTNTSRYAGISGIVTGSSGSSQIGALIFSTKTNISDTQLTERARFDSTGNFSIGTTAITDIYSGFSGQTQKVVDIQGTTSNDNQGFASLIMSRSQSSSASKLIGAIHFANTFDGGAEKRIAQIHAITDGDTDSGALGFGTASNGTYTTQMALSSSGNLGIGTTSSLTSKLDILPTASFGAAGVSGITQRAHTITLTGANPTTYATFYAAQIGAMTLAGTNTNQTVTDAAGLVVAPPIKSTNVAVTTTHGILVPTTAVSTATTGVGLTVNAPTGATNNYAAIFSGGNVGVGTTTTTTLLDVNGIIRVRNPQGETTAPTRANNGEFAFAEISSTGRLYFRSNGTNRFINHSGSGDFSEYMHKADQNEVLQPGAIVKFDEDGKITKSTNSSKVVGVVSAFGTKNNDDFGGMRHADSRYANIGLIGHVPVIVTSENGYIASGDVVAAGSSIPGTGKAADNQTNFIVGTALQSFNPGAACQSVSSFDTIPWPAEVENYNPENLCFRLPDGTYVGKIMVFVRPQLHNTNLAISTSGEVTLAQSGSEWEVTSSEAGLVTQVTAYAKSTIGELTAGLVESQQLKVLGQADIDALITRQLSVVNSSGTQILSAQDDQVTINADLNVSGTTALGQLVAGDVVAESLVVNEASVAGLTTQAADITSARIAALEVGMAEFQDIKAQTAELVTATVSGTLYAANIDGLDAKIASTLQEPGFQELLNPTEEPAAANPESVTSILDSISATQSADLNITLSDLALTPGAVIEENDATFIREYLSVNGNTYIAESLGVGQALFIGQGTTFADGSWSYTAPEGQATALFIQPHGQGSIDFLAGTLTISDTGSVVVTGDFTVRGNAMVEETLLAKELQPLEFGNPLQVQLSGEVDGELKESNFEIVDALGTPVATISAQGTAQFRGLRVDGNAEFTGTVLGVQTSTPSAQTTSQTGQSTLPSGTTEVVISSAQVSANSLIYITPVGSTQNQVLYLKSQDDNANTFTVGIDSSVSQDIVFNWRVE